MTYVKNMELVKASFRDNIDLRQYKVTILNCVKAVIPTADVFVHQHYFEIQTHAAISGNEARLIGRKMGKTQLSRFLIEHLYPGGFTGRSGKIFKEKK